MLNARRYDPSLLPVWSSCWSVIGVADSACGPTKHSQLDPGVNTLKVSSRVSGIQIVNPKLETLAPTWSLTASGDDAARTLYQYKQAVVIAKVNLNLVVDSNLGLVASGNGLGDINTIWTSASAASAVTREFVLLPKPASSSIVTYTELLYICALALASHHWHSTLNTTFDAWSPMHTPLPVLAVHSVWRSGLVQSLTLERVGPRPRPVHIILEPTKDRTELQQTSLQRSYTVFCSYKTGPNQLRS